MLTHRARACHGDGPVCRGYQEYLEHNADRIADENAAWLTQVKVACVALAVGILVGLFIGEYTPAMLWLPADEQLNAGHIGGTVMGFLAVFWALQRANAQLAIWQQDSYHS